MTPEEFSSKIDWEGGPYDAYLYGLSPDDLDDPESELAQAWSNFVTAAAQASHIFDTEVLPLLPEPGEEVNY